MGEWLFQVGRRLDRLEKIGDRTAVLARLIPWEEFREELNRVREVKNVKLGGRPPYDVVMMFKILILQGLYNLSDEDMEYQIVDRLSFQKFLGIEPGKSVPDSNTIWNSREKLKNKRLFDPLFARFERFLCQSGMEAKGGQMVDATFAQVPVRRDTPEDNDSIKKTGEAPEKWTPNQRSHKDLEARWTQKRGKNYFGYKLHACVDAGGKFIRKIIVTPANVHDSQHFEDLLDPNAIDRNVFADAGYTGAVHVENLLESNFIPQICERKTRNHPLTDAQKASNKQKSHIRIRVEHVFGHMTQRCRGRRVIHTIGLLRAQIKLTLQSLAYNMSRFCIISAK